MKVLKNSLWFTVAITIVFYLGGSFIYSSFNPSAWDRSERKVIGGIWIFLVSFATVLGFFIKRVNAEIDQFNKEYDGL